MTNIAHPALGSLEYTLDPFHNRLTKIKGVYSRVGDGWWIIIITLWANNIALKLVKLGFSDSLSVRLLTEVRIT